MRPIVECTPQHPEAIQNCGGMCRIDGTCFDVGGHCAHGHAQGGYYYPLSTGELDPAKPAQELTTKVECRVININFMDICNICGSSIADPIRQPWCQLGHTIGMVYEITPR